MSSTLSWCGAVPLQLESVRKLLHIDFVWLLPGRHIAHELNSMQLETLVSMPVSVVRASHGLG